MNQNEKIVAKKLSRILRAARKRNGMTQSSVAALLGTSQANVSKLENGVLIPSALEWFEFCSATGIAPETIRTGYLDRGESVSPRSDRMECGTTLPQRYAENRASKIRTAIPFLSYFESIHGQDKLCEFVKAHKIDPDLFVDYNAQISLNFILDITRQLISEGNLKPADFARLVSAVKAPGAHGTLQGDYENEREAKLFKTFIANAKFYEANFHYTLEEKSDSLLVLSVAPERHLRDLEYKGDPTLGDFLCRYKKHYFAAFTGYGGARAEASLKEVECHYHGAERCVYRIELAGEKALARAV